MKKTLKKIVLKLVTIAARRLGYRLVSTHADFSQQGVHKDALLAVLFGNLQAMDFHPTHIVDVGSNRGTWTREVLQYFPDAHYTLLEPQSWLTESFQDLLDKHPKIKLHNVGAGAQEGSFMFTLVDRDDSCSFRYTEQEAKEAGFKQVEIPVVTLNTLLKNTDLPAPDLIKIDAEGLDLEVLQGASEFFGITEIFMVEAGVGNKSFDNDFVKLVNFMDENGYRLFDISDLNRPYQPQVLWLVELVFVKKNGKIDSQVLAS